MKIINEKDNNENPRKVIMIITLDPNRIDLYANKQGARFVKDRTLAPVFEKSIAKSQLT